VKTGPRRLLIGGLIALGVVVLLCGGAVLYVVNGNHATQQKGQRVFDTIVLPAGWQRGPVKYDSGGFIINDTGPRWTMMVYATGDRANAPTALNTALGQSGWQYVICSEDSVPCWYLDQRDSISINYDIEANCPATVTPCTPIQITLFIYDQPQIFETPATPKSLQHN
jgi:hypothetical protein